MVSSLPTSNISATTVYLLKTGAESQNLYTEYIYVNSAWEYLGKQSVDLTGYALKTDIPTKLSALTNDAGFITKTVSDLTNYYTKTESDNKYQAKGNYLTAIPSEYVTETELTSKGYAKQSDVTALSEHIANMNGDLPDYVVTEAEDVINKIINKQGNRTFTFVTITDMHYGSSNYKDGIKHAGQAIKYIRDRVPLDGVFMLGDNTDDWASNSLTEWLNDVMAVNMLIDTDLNVQGNHDFYQYHSPLTARLVFGNNKDVVYGNRLGGYFYRDYEDFKLRVIGVNTNETGGSNMNTSQAQYEWFINTLDLSAKSDAEEWQILIISHMPLDWYDNNFYYAYAYILDAYTKGTSWSGNGLSCNFEGKNKAVLVGNIHGHIHNFLVDKIYIGNPENTTQGQTSVYRMAMPTARIDTQNHYGGVWQEPKTYSKTRDTAEDTAFCVCCLDLDTNKIEIICYGAGYDRTLKYSEGSYTPSEPSTPDTPSTTTNWLLSAKETDGTTLYNGTGYKDGYRFKSDGTEVSASGFAITGYIPAKLGDVIRITKDLWTYTITNQEYQGIKFYKSNYSTFNNSSTPYWYIKDNSRMNIVEYDNYIELTLTKEVSESVTDITNCTYIRFCVNSNGLSTGVITINQPITSTTTPEVTYTNMLSKAINADGTPYRGTNGEIGYKVGYRLNSSGVEASNSEYCVTGFIPLEDYDWVYLKHMNFTLGDTTAQPNTRVYIYDSSFTAKNAAMSLDVLSSAVFTNPTDEAGGSLETGEDLGRFRFVQSEGKYYVRFSTKKIDENSIVTINEEIPYAPSTSYTNQLVYSTDENGSIFNGKGWMYNKRVNSSYEIVDAPYYNLGITGYIPFKEDDVLRSSAGMVDLSGADGSSYQRIVMYDADKKAIGYVTYNANLTNLIISDEGAIEYTHHGSWISIPTTCAYIRCVFYGVKVGGVLTVNEEIV